MWGFRFLSNKLLSTPPLNSVRQFAVPVDVIERSANSKVTIVLRAMQKLLQLLRTRTNRLLWLNRRHRLRSVGALLRWRRLLLRLLTRTTGPAHHIHSAVHHARSYCRTSAKCRALHHHTTKSATGAGGSRSWRRCGRRCRRRRWWGWPSGGWRRGGAGLASRGWRAAGAAEKSATAGATAARSTSSRHGFCESLVVFLKPLKIVRSFYFGEMWWVTSFVNVALLVFFGCGR